MPDIPFRLKVMMAVTDQLKTITSANGYNHDLSDFTDEAGRPAERVYRGRDRFGESDALPFISILEDFRAQDATNEAAPNGTAQENDWALLIQGFVKDDKDHPLDPVYWLEADVRRALVAAKNRYDILGLGDRAPCVVDMKLQNPVCRPADGEVSDVAYFFLKVTLTLVEDLESPFA